MEGSTRKEKTALFYERIRERYCKLTQKTKNGKPVYSQKYMFEVLGEEFYRSPKTIENIIFNRV